MYYTSDSVDLIHRDFWVVMLRGVPFTSYDSCESGVDITSVLIGLYFLCCSWLGKVSSVSTK